MSCDGILGGVIKKTNTHLPTNGTMWMTGQFTSVILIDGALCYVLLRIFQSNIHVIIVRQGSLLQCKPMVFGQGGIFIVSYFL